MGKARPENQLSESELKERIKKRIKARWPDAVIWTNFEGGVYTRGGAYLNIAEPGRPDLMMVIEGKFYAMEIKRPGHEYPSAKQVEYMEKLNSPRAGGPGTASVISSVKAAIAWITGGEEQLALLNVEEILL